LATLDPRTSLTFDPRAIATALDHFRVRWVLTGALALSAYGAPHRDDLVVSVHVVPDGDEDNLDRLATALQALDAVPAADTDASPSHATLRDQRTWYPWPATDENLTGLFTTRAGRLSVLSPELYPVARVNARTAVLGGMRVQVDHPAAAHEIQHGRAAPAGRLYVEGDEIPPPEFPAELAQAL